MADSDEHPRRRSPSRSRRSSTAPSTTTTAVAGRRHGAAGTRWGAHASGPEGGFSLAGFAPGVYTLVGSFGGRCGLTPAPAVRGRSTARGSVSISDEKYRDDEGHTCGTSASRFIAADTVLTLTGDDAVGEVALPFVFPFYGQAYRRAWVDTNGLLSFTDPAGPHGGPGWPATSRDQPPGRVGRSVLGRPGGGCLGQRTHGDGSGTGPATSSSSSGETCSEAAHVQRMSFQACWPPMGLVTSTTTGSTTTMTTSAAPRPWSASKSPGRRRRPGLFGRDAGTGHRSGDHLRHPSTAEPLAKHELSGTLSTRRATRYRRTVTLDPTGLATTTGADGAWRFRSVVADSYTITAAQHNRCGPSVERQVDLTEDTVRALQPPSTTAVSATPAPSVRPAMSPLTRRWL